MRKRSKHKPKRIKELWKPGPLPYFTSERDNKKLCVRITRRNNKQRLTHDCMATGWNTDLAH